MWEIQTMVSEPGSFGSIKNLKIGLKMGGTTFEIEKFNGTSDFFLWK